MQKQQDLITDKLKSLYNSVEEEEIPDKFIEMLEKLEQAENAMKKSESEKDDD